MTINHVSTTQGKEPNLLRIDSDNVHKCAYMPLFASGMVAKIGTNRFTTLMAIASYMDTEGYSSPTQVQLAEAIGVHKNTVNKYINDLLDLEIDGIHLLTRQIVNRGQGNIVSTYRINLSMLVKNKEAKKVRTVKRVKEFDVKDAMEVFEKTYREVYNVNYSVSHYAREMGLLKSKVITPYPDMAKEIVEIAVRKYDQLFKSAKYPRPSIAMFSWAVNQLIPMIEEERKLTKLTLQSSEIEAQAEKRLAERMAKLTGGSF